MEPIFAATGIFTPIIQAAAAAIAAGAVVGGFVGATNGVRYGSSRKEVEGNALRETYIGGVAGIGFWLVDQCILYISFVWTS